MHFFPGDCLFTIQAKILGLKTVGLCGRRNKQQHDHGESNPLTPHTGWVPPKCWAVWLSEDLRVRSQSEEL